MAIWTPTQKVTAKKIKEEGCTRVFSVEVPAPRVQEAVHNVFLRLQLSAKISGFRPGKAPIDRIKQQYSGQARAQAVEDIVQAVVPEVLKDMKVRPLAVPSVGALRLEADSPLSFELSVEVAPEFDPKGYKGLSLTKKVYEAADSDVASRLTQLQEGNARLEPSKSEAVSKEHYAVIDYSILREGKPAKGGEGKAELVDLSSDQTVKGLQEGLLGARRGEPREFTVEIDGKSASCRATVTEIKEKILPALDDEFAKDLGFDALDALKAKLRELVAAEGAERSERELTGQIEQALLAANPIPVPPSLAEQNLEHTLSSLVRRLAGPNRTLPDSELQSLREKIRPQAENQVRLQMILSRIALKEKIEVSEDELKAELARSLEKAESDEQRKDVERFFAEGADEVRAHLRDRKVLAFIRGAAKVSEAKA